MNTIPQSSGPPQPLLLTVKQTASILQLGINRTYELCRSGSIPTIRVGTTFRIPRLALERWIEDQLEQRIQ